MSRISIVAIYQNDSTTHCHIKPFSASEGVFAPPPRPVATKARNAAFYTARDDPLRSQGRSSSDGRRDGQAERGGLPHENRSVLQHKQRGPRFHGRAALPGRSKDALNKAKNVCGDTITTFRLGCWRRSMEIGR